MTKMIGVRVYVARKGEAMHGTGGVYRFDRALTKVKSLHSDAVTRVSNGAAAPTWARELIESGVHSGDHTSPDGTTWANFVPEYEDE